MLSVHVVVCGQTAPTGTTMLRCMRFKDPFVAAYTMTRMSPTAQRRDSYPVQERLAGPIEGEVEGGGIHRIQVSGCSRCLVVWVEPVQQLIAEVDTVISCGERLVRPRSSPVLAFSRTPIFHLRSH